jgi:hypothetical protein
MAVAHPLALLHLLLVLPIMNSAVADAVFWLAVACCFAGQIAIFRTLGATRGRARAVPGVPVSRTGVDVVWAVLPAVALALVLSITWRAMHPLTSATAGRAESAARHGEAR